MPVDDDPKKQPFSPECEGKLFEVARRNPVARVSAFSSLGWGACGLPVPQEVLDRWVRMMGTEPGTGCLYTRVTGPLGAWVWQLSG